MCLQRRICCCESMEIVSTASASAACAVQSAVCDVTFAFQYVDLDEFLSENGMPGEGLGGGHLGGSAFGAGAGLALGLQAPVTKRERSPSPSDCMSPDTINPPLSPADSSMYSIFLTLHLISAIKVTVVTLDWI